MKLTFINRYFYPDHSATSQMLSDLAFGLAAGGINVTIITSRLAYDDTNDSFKALDTIKGVTIHRVWTSRFGRHALLGRAVDYATFYLSSAWKLLALARRGDLVIAKTDPPMIGITSRYIARLRGAHFANWLQDIFPEVAIELGMNSGAARTVFSIARNFRNSSLKNADFNVAIGNRMAERLSGLGVEEGKIRIIPNWADTQAIHPVAAPENPLRQNWQLQDKFVVGYSGNLGRAHEVETLLGAIAPIQNDPACSQIRFLFIGGGAQYEILKKACKDRGLAIVRFEPYQPRDRLAQSLSAADVHLVTLRPELEGLIVPSKFYGVAAAGRATIFIGAQNGEVADLLRVHACGLTVPQGDSVQLANSIKALAVNTDTCTAMGRNARAAAEKAFGLTQALDAWGEALRTLN